MSQQGPAVVGYARVSRPEQHLDMQLDALRAAGCERIYQETASGARLDRPVLAECLRYLRAGDVLVVWALDRLGRDLPHLVRTVTDLEARGIGFRCITQEFDTTTAMGKLYFHLFAMLAQFERDRLRERTLEGLTAARARGRRGGRRPTMTPEDARMALALYDDGKSVARIAKRFGVGRTTVYDRLRELRAQRSADGDDPPPDPLRAGDGDGVAELPIA